MSGLAGQLLLASGTLLDPNFRQTVVLIAEHNEEGAMGVVLNRPSDALVTEAVPHLEQLVPAGEPIYVGGPVETGAVIVLAEFAEPDAAAAIAFDRVGFLRADVDPSGLEGAVRRVRVFAGYSGWGPGQLEAELAEEAWILEPATVERVFAEPADPLWGDILRRKGGIFAVLALMPDDPSLN